MGMAIFSEELIGIAEIADMAHVSPNVAHNWYKRHADFPEPLKVLKCGPIFQIDPVRAWLKKRTFETMDGGRRAFARSRCPNG